MEPFPRVFIGPFGAGTAASPEITAIQTDYGKAEWHRTWFSASVSDTRNEAGAGSIVENYKFEHEIDYAERSNDISPWVFLNYGGEWYQTNWQESYVGLGAMTLSRSHDYEGAFEVGNALGSLIPPVNALMRRTGTKTVWEEDFDTTSFEQTHGAYYYQDVQTNIKDGHEWWRLFTTEAVEWTLKEYRAVWQGGAWVQLENSTSGVEPFSNVE
ncbi:MAG: hypothetical protein HYV60_10205 [Planctomycetia bacterium]|nr:hypothetical protein [Planctomycetia bacterium]